MLARISNSYRLALLAAVCVAAAAPLHPFPASSATVAAVVSWQLPPPGYRFEPPAFCPRQGARRNTYDVCADQMTILAAALGRAKAQKKLLFVVFGATWCPICEKFQQQLKSREFAGGNRAGFDIAASFEVIEIAVSTMAGGRRQPIASGEAVLGQVLRRAPGKKLRAVPFVAVFDPADASRVFARNMDDLPARAGRFENSAVAGMLRDALAQVRDGKAAPAEPSWLMRKWRRLRNRLATLYSDP